MKKVFDYIPGDIIKEAHDFVKLVDEDVEIYRKILSCNLVKPSDKADSFTAYWSLERYSNYPHALITLFEYKQRITDAYGKVDELNALNFVVYKLEKYYEVLKYFKMIEE